MPDTGWQDALIEEFLSFLSALDSNNHVANVGGGEREGRLASALVRRRHYGFAHGIGRSGELTAEQPKAPGSTIMANMARLLALDALRLAGYGPSADSLLLMPCATGMSLTLTLMAIKAEHEKAYPGDRARYVLWSRIDQKSCFKSVIAAGLSPVVVDCVWRGDELITDVKSIEEHIIKLGKENIVAVLTTTSCFAPRAPDLVVDVALLCARHSLAHVVNNAYGIGAAATARLVNSAATKGRVDCFVSSLDKNFLVPVGGAVIVCDRHHGGLLSLVASRYPGRASSTPCMDLLITLISLGASGWKKLLEERESNFSALVASMGRVASAAGERLLNTPSNPISMALSIHHDRPSFLGSMIFSRAISGPRVVSLTGRSLTAVDGHAFVNFGSHTSLPPPCQSPPACLTVAAALGQSQQEANILTQRIEKILRQFQKRREKEKEKNEST